VPFEQRFDQAPIDIGFVDVRLAPPHAHFGFDEVDDNATIKFRRVRLTEVEHDVAGNTGRRDRRLIEALLERHVEDWVNALFLSCRFTGHRDDPANFNEFVMTFFKALSDERIAYVERKYRERRRATDEFFERDGYRIERWCPHRQADLTKFGEISDGVLTCSLHHWQFDLETGRCLTSADRHLRCERIDP